MCSAVFTALGTFSLGTVNSDARENPFRYFNRYPLRGISYEVFAFLLKPHLTLSNFECLESFHSKVESMCSEVSTALIHRWRITVPIGTIFLSIDLLFHVDL